MDFSSWQTVFQKVQILSFARICLVKSRPLYFVNNYFDPNSLLGPRKNDSFEEVANYQLWCLPCMAHTPTSKLLIKKSLRSIGFPHRLYSLGCNSSEKTFKTRCHRINTKIGSESSTRQWCLRLLIGRNWPIYHTDHSARLCKTLSIDSIWVKCNHYDQGRLENDCGRLWRGCWGPQGCRWRWVPIMPSGKGIAWTGCRKCIKLNNGWSIWIV